MSHEEIQYQQPEHDDLDTDARFVVVVQNKEIPDGKMDERLVSSIDTVTKLNLFFDKFDEQIAYPNEKDIKYDVGSDGLAVIVVTTVELSDKVLSFIDEYTHASLSDTEEESSISKKRKQ